jgi:hypothetical protein
MGSPVEWSGNYGKHGILADNYHALAHESRPGTFLNLTLRGYRHSDSYLAPGGV